MILLAVFILSLVSKLKVYTKRAAEIHLNMTNYFHLANKNSAVSFILSHFEYAMLICELIYLPTLKANELARERTIIIKFASAKQ